MNSTEKPDKDTAARSADAFIGEPADAPAWTEGLKQLYDSVVDEPLPERVEDVVAGASETGSGKATD